MRFGREMGEAETERWTGLSEVLLKGAPVGRGMSGRKVELQKGSH